MTAQRGNANLSHIGMIYFSGWNTVVMKGSYSVSNAESYHLHADNTNFWIESLKTHTTTFAPVKSKKNYIQQIFNWAKQLFSSMKRVGITCSDSL